ncbi:putative SET and MYND domain-containing protein [Paratrimastix pyriformis]|uniref:SET and MYND domain-containing protein n=1 Tax=Paratrimastix pyriformis TaxID=342808 RepID=A0ABQ8UEY2_9EUKA|nr:putative SET and MYND domain-containing protein [Paratrimastix pyriformis]
MRSTPPPGFARNLFGMSHKLSDLFRVEKSPTAGRFCIAERDIAEGELILHSPPLGLAFYTLCYCSRACMEADAPLHKHECMAMQLDTRIIKDADARCVIRLFTYMILERERENFLRMGQPAPAPGPYKVDDVMTLVANEESFDEEQLKRMRAVARLVVQFVPPLPPLVESTLPEDFPVPGTIMPDITAETALQLQCITAENGFTIRPDLGFALFPIASFFNPSYMTPIPDLGFALFPIASFFNHSCIPNATFSQNGTALNIHALRDIHAGEEITLNYIPLFSSTGRRREHLHRVYHFPCGCPRCSRDLAAEIATADPATLLPPPDAFPETPESLAAPPSPPCPPPSSAPFPRAVDERALTSMRCRECAEYCYPYPAEGEFAPPRSESSSPTSSTTTTTTTDGADEEDDADDQERQHNSGSPQGHRLKTKKERRAAAKAHEQQGHDHDHDHGHSGHHHGGHTHAGSRAHGGHHHGHQQQQDGPEEQVCDESLADAYVVVGDFETIVGLIEDEHYQALARGRYICPNGHILAGFG